MCDERQFSESVMKGRNLNDRLEAGLTCVPTMPSPPKKLCSRLYRCMEPPSPLAAPSTFPNSSAITSFTYMNDLRFILNVNIECE